MSSANRAALFAKIHKVLKKHYEPLLAPSDRSVLEHMLYACVLENARPDHVDDVFARLLQNYFDWNEVRVTSLQELAEVMSAIPDAIEAAKRLKRALQSVFERYYQFDLEPLRKAGLGKAVEALDKFNGVTPFVIDYVTQNALGGHAIPLNTAGLALLQVLDAVTAADAAKGKVPGLERAIAKNKAPEFTSLLHQLAVEFAANPQSTKVKTIVGEIVPEAKDRLPKKAPTPPPAPAPTKRVIAPPEPVPGSKPAAAEKGEKPGDKGAERPGGEKHSADRRAAEKASADKQAGDKSAAVKGGGDKGGGDKGAAEKTGGEKGSAAKGPAARPAKLSGGDVTASPSHQGKGSKPAGDRSDKEGSDAGERKKPDKGVVPRSEGKPSPKAESKTKSPLTGITRKKPK